MRWSRPGWVGHAGGPISCPTPQRVGYGTLGLSSQIATQSTCSLPAHATVRHAGATDGMAIKGTGAATSLVAFGAPPSSRICHFGRHAVGSNARNPPTPSPPTVMRDKNRRAPSATSRGCATPAAPDRRTASDAAARTAGSDPSKAQSSAAALAPQPQHHPPAPPDPPQSARPVRGR